MWTELWVAIGLCIVFIISAGLLFAYWFKGFYDWATEVRSNCARHERLHPERYNWNYPDEFPDYYPRKNKDTDNLTWDQRVFEDELIRQTTEQALRNITPFEQGGDNIDYGMNPSFEPPEPPDPPQDFGNFGGMF